MQNLIIVKESFLKGETLFLYRLVIFRIFSHNDHVNKFNDYIGGIKYASDKI